MRTRTTPRAAAGLLLLAITSLAVGVAGAVFPSPASRGASRAQDPAPPPGTRCTRERGESCKRPGDQNQPPTVELRASEFKITLACPEGTTSPTCTPSDSAKVQLHANASDPDGDTILYTYTATGGRVSGDGADVTWDLTGLKPGTYTANVEVDDCCGCVAFSSVQVKVETCSGCGAPR